MKDFKGDMMSNINDNYEKINYSTSFQRTNQFQLNSQNDETLKNREEQIKTLKHTIKAYQKNVDDLNKNLSSYDNLMVEYQSLNQNYASVEYALNQYKLENSSLREKLQAKDAIIADFQRIIEVSTAKFQMFEQTNTALRLKNEEYETKLKVLPSLTSKNEQLNQKIKENEMKLQNFKTEAEKKEELYKVKMVGMERSNKLALRQLEEEISDLKVVNEKLKVENEKFKKELQLVNSSFKEKEDQHTKTLYDKQKENDRLLKSIQKMQNDIMETNISTKEKSSNDEKVINNLKDENEKLNQIIMEKNSEIEQLNSTIGEFDDMFKSAKKEIDSKDMQLSTMQEEKEKLVRQLNDRQIDFVEYQNSSQKEVDILHSKLLAIDKEKSNLLNRTSDQGDEIKQLKEQISFFEQSDKKKNDEYSIFYKKYEDLMQTLKTKDVEHNNEYMRYGEIIKKSQNEIDLLKAKYEKKIQFQKLKIDELSTRISNLINYFIGLKDYALSLERNINDTSQVLNNSMYVTSPYSLNAGGNNDNAYSKQLINGMKEMILRIDSKILANNNSINMSSMSYNNFD